MSKNRVQNYFDSNDFKEDRYEQPEWNNEKLFDVLDKEFGSKRYKSSLSFLAKKYRTSIGAIMYVRRKANLIKKLEQKEYTGKDLSRIFLEYPDERTLRKLVYEKDKNVR